MASLGMRIDPKVRAGIETYYFWVFLAYAKMLEPIFYLII